MPPTRPYLDRIPVADEDLLLINVEVHGRDDGEVGRGPLVKVDDELEREVGQLLADGGEDEGAVGGEAEEGPVEGAEDAAARCQAEGAPGAEAATDAVAQGALLVRLAVPRVALDEVAPEAAAPAGAVPVPEELLGLQEGPVTGRESCGPAPYHPQVLRPRLTPLCRTANESWQRGQKKKKRRKDNRSSLPLPGHVSATDRHEETARLRCHRRLPRLSCTRTNRHATYLHDPFLVFCRPPTCPIGSPYSRTTTLPGYGCGAWLRHPVQNPFADKRCGRL